MFYVSDVNRIEERLLESGMDNYVMTDTNGKECSQKSYCRV